MTGTSGSTGWTGTPRSAQTAQVVAGRAAPLSGVADRMTCLLAWARERFPLRNALFFAVFYVTTLAVARRTAASDGPLAAEPRDAAGFAALWAFFLVLRIMDEHKDFDADAVAHPERILQRGLVTLGDLRAVGAIALAPQLAVNAWYDGGVGVATRWWLAALGWSLLMAREFFVRRWLRARIMTYALSHMLVMPLLVGWIAALGAQGAPPARATLAAAALAFAGGLALEMARKLRAPPDERPMADSYTGALGIRTATATLIVVLTATSGAVIAVLRATGGSAGALGISTLAVSTLGAAVALASFARAPTTARARLAEHAAALAVMAGHVVVLAAVVSQRGVRVV